MIGRYGQGWREGVLVDHAEETRVSASGRREWAVIDGHAYPVLCGDIVRISTEDGPTDGRCGNDVVPGRHACAWHADERDSWLGASEIERAEWEREFGDIPDGPWC